MAGAPSSSGEDDAYRPERAPEASRSLIDPGAFALAVRVAASEPWPPRRRRRTRSCPGCSPSAATRVWPTPVGRPWTVALAVSYRTEPLLMARHVADTHPGGARVALVSIDDQFAGQVFENAIAAAFGRFPQLELLGPLRHRLDGADAG